MKNFFKFFFASCLGTIVGIFLLVFALSMLAVIYGGEDEVSIKPNAVVEVKLDYPIPVRTSNNPFENMNFGSFEPQKNLGLNDILANIKKAKMDDDVKGIYLNMNNYQGGFYNTYVIHKAILDFKASGKFVVAYGEYMSQLAYLLASAANEVYINPQGGLMVNGLSTELAYFKGTLEKLGVEAQIFARGKYKSAVEPFHSDSMSAPNEFQIRELLESGFDVYSGLVADARDIEDAQMDSIILKFLARMPSDAKRLGLVDGLKYDDQIKDIFREKLGLEEDDDLNMVALGKYNGVEGEKEKPSKEKIAVLYAVGNIVDGEAQDGSIASAQFIKVLQDIRHDENIKALVLYVSSPGGSALASEQILREVDLIKEKMPVIVSMGAVAASGGYYISCHADTIFASENTVTGSIGVFAMIPNMQGLLTDKMGITFDGVKVGEYSDFGAISRPFNEKERAVIDEAIDSIYMVFKTQVAEGRGMTLEQVEELAQGRVYSGIDAKAVGLVDVIGELEDAIAYAESLVGEGYRIKEFPVQKDPIEELMKGLSGEAETYFMQQKLGENYEMYKKVEQFIQLDGYQMLMPYELDVK